METWAIVTHSPYSVFSVKHAPMPPTDRYVVKNGKDPVVALQLCVPNQNLVLIRLSCHTIIAWVDVRAEIVTVEDGNGFYVRGPLVVLCRSIDKTSGYTINTVFYQLPAPETIRGRDKLEVLSILLEDEMAKSGYRRTVVGELPEFRGIQVGER